MMTFLILTLVTALADGDAAMQRGDYDTAVREYRAQVQASPGSYEAKFRLARALAFSRHRDEAIRLYTELLAESPGNSDVLLARGRVYAWEDRWAEAEADLQAVVAQKPSYGDAWSALGDVYLWSDRPEGAALAYGQWIAADPVNPAAYVARGRARHAQGDAEGARRDFEAARSLGLPEREADEYLATLQKRRFDQESALPEGFTWLANLSVGRSSFSPVEDTWNHYEASLRRYWKQGSLALEYLDSRRFGYHSYALALDGYIDVAPRAYANLRVQYAPTAELFPKLAYRAELFQGVGKGWELSGSYDAMRFTSSNVAMYGIGIGKYTGDWYFRWKTLFIPSPARLGVSNRVLARYYFSGNGDDYVEINGGFGQGGEFFRDSTDVQTTRGSYGGAALQKYLDRHWGFKLSAGYGSENIYPYREVNASANIMRRW